MQHWLTVVLLGLMLTLSGCIQAIDDGNETATASEPEPIPVQRSAGEGRDCSFDAPTLPLGDQPVCQKYDVEIPEPVFQIDFELEWSDGMNSYSLQVESPSGERFSAADASDQRIELELDDVKAGTYVFWARAETVAFADELELTVTYHWMENAGDEIALPEPTVQVEQRGDRWRATIRYVAVGEVADEATLAVGTINGGIDMVATNEDESRIDMTAFAYASSESRARELVQAIKVQVDVTSEQLRAQVKEQPRQLSDGEGVGAHVELQTDAILGGSARTTNGDITFDGTSFRDLTVSSTNGGFEGTAIAHGDLTGSTTNGGFELDLTPKESLALDLSTTNGGSDIGLKELDGIGYRIGAKTTNGDISEEMDEASLTGKDNDAVLETSGFAERTIKVTGKVSSTNGSITFIGR